MLQERVSRPWMLFSWLYKFSSEASDELNQKKRLDDFTMRMIRKRTLELENGGFSGRKSLLDFMIEISKAQTDFTERDIVDEACTFMLAVSF
jgi:cytochrome P450 family 4